MREILLLYQDPINHYDKKPLKNQVKNLKQAENGRIFLPFSAKSLSKARIKALLM
jgi:hypothetical protein